jgi:hypothetical protein
LIGIHSSRSHGQAVRLERCAEVLALRNRCIILF